MDHHKNIIRIKAIANALKDLERKVVFVGGATLSLYNDQPVLEVRPTDDIDVIVELSTYSERSDLEEQLRAIGFKHDVESGLICRYNYNNTIVDIMPTNDNTVGFQNKWYEEGFQNAIDYRIDDLDTINILKSTYYLATKLEAFKGRGNMDGRTSHDFEDIVFLLENRSTIWDELTNADVNVKEYLKIEFNKLLQNRYFPEWIRCHIDPSLLPSKEKEILKRLNDFCL